jgi:RND family efflux transporter MFP subunit
MTSNNNPRAGTLSRGRSTLVILIISAAALGVFVGTRWHTWFGPAAGKAPAATHAVQLWTCSMHPQVIQDHPGQCPICHMELTPLKAGSTSAALMIDPVVVQNAGIRTAAVTEGPVRRSVRLVGYLDEAQPNVYEVNLRVSGWIRRLHAATEGQQIQAGDPLIDLYSPDLQVAIEELIAGRRAKNVLASGADASSRDTAAALYDAANTKLALLGLDPRQIQALSKLDRAPETVTFTSPVSGVLADKSVVEGSAVKMGDRVMRVVDYSTLWLDAQAFEKDLPFIEPGQAATAQIASLSGDAIRGKILFIHPRVDPNTRTTLVRLEVPNPSLTLRPGMYAVVRTEHQIADRAVLVPREAIIDSGERQIAFVPGPAGTFEPRAVRMGVAAENGMVQIVEGLHSGESVVTSGQFLLDSESRTREAIQKYIAGRQEAAASGTTALPGAAQIDALISRYLDLAAALGAVPKSDEPLDLEPLIDAAASVQQSGRAPAGAEDIVAAARAMLGHPLSHQREAFKPLSEAMVRLVESSPPSRAVGEAIFVIRCPMVDAHWLQRTPDVANPYYGAEMKDCGSVEKTIQTRVVPP